MDVCCICINIQMTGLSDESSLRSCTFSGLETLDNLSCACCFAYLFIECTNYNRDRFIDKTDGRQTDQTNLYRNFAICAIYFAVIVRASC